MKIGILTFHRAHNYGAVLQCYALLQYLRELGHTVNVIDYRQPFIEKVYKPINWVYFLKKLCKPYKFVKYLFEIKKNIQQKKHFERFQKEYLALTDACDFASIPQQFDMYVIGSDQLWSGGTGTIDRVYTGFFAHKKESVVYGYAISTTVSYVQSLGAECVLNISKNFNKLSFREKDVCEFLKESLKIQSFANIDPTLLVNQSVWDNLQSSRWRGKEYVILYQVRGNLAHQKKIRTYALEVAKRENCELVDLSSFKESFAVEDFVGCFKQARAVVTTSFHATVFSLIYKRPLYSYMLGEASDCRIRNLLSKLDAEKCIYELDSAPREPYVIPGNLFAQKLSEERLISKNYFGFN